MEDGLLAHGYGWETQPKLPQAQEMADIMGETISTYGLRECEALWLPSVFNNPSIELKHMILHAKNDSRVAARST